MKIDRNFNLFNNLHKNHAAWNNSNGTVSSYYDVTGLPLLDVMLNNVGLTLGCSLNNTVVIYIHHALKTSVNLLDAFFKLGLFPKNTFVMGKPYSDHKETVDLIKSRGVHYQDNSVQTQLAHFKETFFQDVRSLWERVILHIENQTHIKNILILDHGGYVNSTVPLNHLKDFRVIGLEKTSGGVLNLMENQKQLSFPVIDVANCATKKILESPLIAEAVVTKLSSVVPITEKSISCGIVGYGAIGKALTDKLLALGHRLIVYDDDGKKLALLKEKPRFKISHNLSSLIENSTFIFGCTGQDITKSIRSLDELTASKTFISCSSGDSEFLTLLSLIQEKKFIGTVVDPLRDVLYKNMHGANIKILKGGFPYNFDHSGESVSAHNIQLTRALVLSGVIQAAQFFDSPDFNQTKGMIALDAKLQKYVVNEWFSLKPENKYSFSTINNFQNLHWIENNSIKNTLQEALLPES